MPQSDTNLTPAPVTQQVLGIGGLLTTPWSQFFQRLYSRVGGGSTAQLDHTNDSLEAIQADVTTLDGKVSAQGATLNAVQSQQVQDHLALTVLQNALAPQSGTWTPTCTGATVSGTVSLSGTWKSIGDELWWEVLIDATAGSIAFASAEITNMPVAASRPGAFAAVSTSTYADHGNGVVVGASAFLPNFTVSAGTAVLSGRYVR